MRRFTYLLIVILIASSNSLLALEGEGKEEVRVGGKMNEEGKKEGKEKRISVFEIVNKLFGVNVKVDGKRFSKEQKAEISGKIESNMKDCVAKVLMEHEEFQKRDKKLFDSDSVLKIKVKAGTFDNIKIMKSVTKSPFIKECLNSLKEFETGYNINSELIVKVKTNIK
ncbi:MAG: hypothetical protein ACP5KG_09785 [Myxococcota bacterium]